jgi:hypothetical protein
MIRRMMQPMPPTDTYPLVDRIIPGGLAGWLQDAKSKDQSPAEMARRLHAEHDLTVSQDTVRRWC